MSAVLSFLWLPFVFKISRNKTFWASGESTSVVKQKNLSSLGSFCWRNSAVTFIDIGANIGSVSAKMAKVRGEGGLQVLAFEPDPIAFSQLRQIANVSAFPLAVTGFGQRIPKKIRLYRKINFCGPNDTKSSSLLSSKKLIDTKNFVFVSSVAIGSILSDQSGKVVLKIDAEGSEYAILVGMVFSGGIRKVERTFVEFHPRKIRFGWVCHFLVWSLYLFLGQRSKVVPWY